MTQHYTIHKFEKNRYFDASYNSLSVEETDYDSLYPPGLMSVCAYLSQAYLITHPETDYKLEAHFREVPRDTTKIFQGSYPGVELRERGSNDYVVAWLIVPVLNERGNYESRN